MELVPALVTRFTPVSLRSYRPAWLSTDIVAGLTLAAVAIPEVMGYTSISQTPLITGLYTVIFPTIAFALLGSSKLLVVGADSDRGHPFPRRRGGFRHRGTAGVRCLQPESGGICSILVIARACASASWSEPPSPRIGRGGFRSDAGLSPTPRFVDDVEALVDHAPTRCAG